MVCPINHNAIRDRRIAGNLIGVQDDGFAIIELLNCPACLTTLARPGIGPTYSDPKDSCLCIECGGRHCGAIPTCSYACSGMHDDVDTGDSWAAGDGPDYMDSDWSR